MFHEWPTATTDMPDLLSELEALRAGSLASSGVPSTGSGQAHPATYRSGAPRHHSPAVARWHAHLHGLATSIHATSWLLAANDLVAESHRLEYEQYNMEFISMTKIQ